jgi:flagellar L-ring protein precursor FlgH
MRCAKSLFVYVSVAAMMVGSGCVTAKQKEMCQVHNEDVMGHQFENTQSLAPEEGSLWTDAGSSRLFSDSRARRVGDLVTVRISEKPTGKLTAKTETSRDSSIEAGIPNLVGVTEKFGSKNSSVDIDSLFKANFKPSFKGEGTNDRSGELEAYVTARVVEVLTNGHLRIWGRQDIKVNNETQHISVSGIVRPEDIDTNNQVQSTYVADAQIMYSGTGVIADKQQPGWLMRGLDRIWPF